RKFRNYPMNLPGKDQALTEICYSLLNDKTGRIWVATYQGLAVFDVAKGTFSPVASNAKVPGTISTDDLVQSQMLEDPVRNGFWICTSKGLNFYSYKDKVFYNFRNNPNKDEIFDDKKYQGAAFVGAQLWYYCRTDTALC